MENAGQALVSSQRIRAYKASLTRRRLLLAALLAVLLTAVAFWRVTQGAWSMPLSKVAALLSPFLSETECAEPEAIIVRAVRLPRFIAAVGAGGMLAMAGAVLQGLLANPLAEPYTLGIAAGAAFGGAVGFIFSSMLVAPLAFAGAVAALLIVSAIAGRGGGGTAYIVLAGIITNAILSAGVTFLKAIADDKLGAIVLWLMGSMSGATWRGAALVWAGAAVLMAPALVYGGYLDAISLGGGCGETLGVNEKKLRMALLYALSFGTAMTVSCFGIIGFVGLVVPHMLRLIIGPSHRALTAFSFLTGGLLLAVADGFAQSLGELPVGVLTAVIGGPFFCWMLVSRKRRPS